MKRIWIALAVLALLAVGCGDDADEPTRRDDRGPHHDRRAGHDHLGSRR